MLQVLQAARLVQLKSLQPISLLPAPVLVVPVPVQVVLIAHRQQLRAMKATPTLVPVKPAHMQATLVPVLVKQQAMQAALRVKQVPHRQLLLTTQVIVGSSLMQARLPAPQVPQTARLVTPIANHRLLLPLQVMQATRQALLQALIQLQAVQQVPQTAPRVLHPVPLTLVTAVRQAVTPVPQVPQQALHLAPKVMQAMPQVLPLPMIRWLPVLRALQAPTIR